MKRGTVIWILSMFILASVCIYQSVRKEDVYISFTNIPGYNYQFIDSMDIIKTKKVIITQTGKLAYQWWEIDVDNTKITKTDLTTFRKLVVNSQQFIINNYGGIKDCEESLSKYRFFILKWENNIPYVLPIKEIRFVME